MTRTSVILCIAAILGCATDGAEPLAFDVRPAMAAIREDTANVARLIGSGSWRDAAAPAERLADTRLASGREAPPGFRYLEERFRDSAAALADALEGGEAATISTAFSSMLSRCDDCHAQYRPGGVTGREVGP